MTPPPTTLSSMSSKMEEQLVAFFDAVNSDDVNRALACCDDDISCTYPDPGRNWQGKERGRTVMTAIFGQLAASAKTASFEVIKVDEAARTVQTREFWGHPRMKVTSTYTFNASNQILSIKS